MIGRLFKAPFAAAVAAAVLTGTLVGGMSIAFASIPDGSGVIHGCYKTKGSSHALNVIDTSKTASCPTGYTGLNWDQTGVQLLFSNGAVSLSLPAQHCAIASFSAPGVVPGDTGIVAPDAASWPAALTLAPLRATAANVLPVDVCNPTSAAASVSNVSVSIWRVSAG